MGVKLWGWGRSRLKAAAITKAVAKRIREGDDTFGFMEAKLGYRVQCLAILAIFALHNPLAMFFQAARSGRNEWWLYLMGIVLVSLGFMLGQVPLVLVLLAGSLTSGDSSDLETFSKTMDFESVGMDPNAGLVLLLTQFVVAVGFLWVVIKYLHQRKMVSLVNAFGRVRWPRFFFGLGVWGGIGLVAEFISWLSDPEAYVWQGNLASFLPLLVVALLLIPIQTSFEELFIRGYLLQGIGLMTRSRWVAVLMSSLVFMSLHLMNPEIARFGIGIMTLYYFLVAVFLAVITLLDDGLELALGIHAATNLFGALAVTYEGSALQTPALFRLDAPDARLILVQTIVAIAVFFLLARRRFGWNDWSRLHAPITTTEKPDGEQPQ